LIARASAGLIAHACAGLIVHVCAFGKQKLRAEKAAGSKNSGQDEVF
jgi:hypothetical protein